MMIGAVLALLVPFASAEVSLRKVSEIPAIGPVSDDGAFLASIDQASIGVWRLSDGRQVHRIPLPRVDKTEESDSIDFSIDAFSPDDKSLAVSLTHYRDRKRGDAAVYWVDLEKESMRQVYLTRRDCGHLVMPGGIEPTVCPSATALFSPDGKHLAISVFSYLEQIVRSDAVSRYVGEAILVDASGAILGNFKDEFRHDPKQYDKTLDYVAESANGAIAPGFGADGHLLGIVRDRSGCEVRDLASGTRVSFLDECSADANPRFIFPGIIGGSPPSCTENCFAHYWDARTGRGAKVAYGRLGGASFTVGGDYAMTTFPDPGARMELRAAPFQTVLFSTPTGPGWDNTWTMTADGGFALNHASGKTIVYETGLRARTPEASAAAVAPPLDVDSPPATKAKPDPDAYAVVIGVEKYRQYGIPAVDFAARDAQTMYAYLTGAMGFDPKNVVLLADEHATRTDFQKNLGSWLMNRVGPKSRVFVYYAGHGSPNPKTGQGYLMPYEADPAYLEDTAYPLSKLYASLGKLPTKDVTVVLDACFSGQGGRSLIVKGTRPLVSVVQSKAEPNTVVLSAAGANQVSASFPEARHGLLTYYLLAGLRGEADAKHDGRITADELIAYVRPAVERAAKLQNVEQTPSLMSPPDVVAKPWIVLAPKK